MLEYERKHWLESWKSICNDICRNNAFFSQKQAVYNLLTDIACTLHIVSSDQNKEVHKSLQRCWLLIALSDNIYMWFTPPLFSVHINRRIAHNEAEYHNAYISILSRMSLVCEY
jgi:hypothetical protein